MFTAVTATIFTLQVIPGSKDKIAILVYVIVDSLDSLVVGVEILGDIF